MQHIHPKQSGFLLMCIEISPHVFNVFVIYTNWSMPSKWKCDFSFYLILIRMKWFYENIFFKCYLLFINMHVKQYIQFHIISLFQTNKKHKTIITNKINLDTDFTNSWSIEFIIFFFLSWKYSSLSDITCGKFAINSVVRYNLQS